jgi:hypothetical protein
LARMVRSKKEYICTYCSTLHLRWGGFCKNCKKQGTLEEHELIAPKPKATMSQHALGERAKRSERSIAKKMTAVDGPDPAYKHIASSTGRVGHITALQVDAISRSYVTENKNRVMPTWLIKAWLQINQRAVDFNKDAFLHIDPPNMPKTFPINGKQMPLSTMAIIGETRHEHLLKRDRALSEIETTLMERTDLDATNLLALIRQILRES